MRWGESATCFMSFRPQPAGAAIGERVGFRVILRCPPLFLLRNRYVLYTYKYLQMLCRCFKEEKIQCSENLGEFMKNLTQKN